MVIIVVIILITLAISLYDYYSSKDANRLTAKVSREKNPRYGAFILHKTHNTVLSGIMIGLLIFIGSYIGVERGFGNGFTPQETIKTDTFLLTLNAPPLDPIETLPPSYKLNGKEGEGTPSEAKEARPEERKTESTDNTPTPERDVQDNPVPVKPKKTSSAEQDVLDFEKKLFAEAKGNQEREKIRQEAEENKRKREEQKKNNSTAQEASKANAGGNNGAKGKTMVNFSLDGRAPHNNDIWYIRNPGYTCGQGASGEVVVKIKVNANGDVVAADVINNVSGLNPCLPEQAKEYARKSRFTPSSKESQEGTITYRFVP